MPSPTIASGEYGDSLTFVENWLSDFDGSTELFDDWRPDYMAEGLHRAGNFGINSSGQIVADTESVDGKRWSLWYTKPEQTSYIQDGQLVMGGLWTNEADPTRVEYEHLGETVQFNNHRAYASFLATWNRKWSNEANGGAGGFITDPDSPNRTWGPGHFFEMEVDFSGMQTQAFRFSWYLLGAYDRAGEEYDDDPEVVEVDLFEFELTPGQEQTLQLKIISGASGGNTPNGSVTIPTSIADFSAGPCKIGLLWRAGILVWYVNGIEVQRDESASRVPSAPHYMVLSREGNSGAKTSPGPGELQAVPPYIPWDAGLFAKNMWFDRDNINTDKAFVNYVHVFAIDGDDGESTAPEIIDTPEPTGLNPRLVIRRQPGFREGRPVQQLVAEPLDGYDPTGKTFTWSSSVPELTFSPQGGLYTLPSLSGLTAEQLGTITIDDGEA